MAAPSKSATAFQLVERPVQIFKDYLEQSIFDFGENFEQDNLRSRPDAGRHLRAGADIPVATRRQPDLHHRPQRLLDHRQPDVLFGQSGPGLHYSPHMGPEFHRMPIATPPLRYLDEEACSCAVKHSMRCRHLSSPSKLPAAPLRD
jgi:hypothetical protein